MDLDTLNSQFQALKARVEPLLDEYEAHRRSPGRGRHHRKHDAAADHLEDGNLEAAGKALGLDRAHAGTEPDESYEKRRRAEIYGAQSAGAVHPTKPEGVEEQGDGSDDDSDDTTKLNATGGDPNAKPVTTAAATGGE